MSAVVTGFKNLASSTSSKSLFYKVKDGERLQFAPMVDADGFVQCYMHEYWDMRPAKFHLCTRDTGSCPGCLSGNKPAYRGYLPIVTSKGEVKVLVFTKTGKQQLEEVAAGLEDTLRGKVITMSRRGSGFDTRYSVTGTGKDATDTVEKFADQLPDVIQMLGPQGRDEIINEFYGDDDEKIPLPEEPSSAVKVVKEKYVPGKNVNEDGVLEVRKQLSENGFGVDMEEANQEDAWETL